MSHVPCAQVSCLVPGLRDKYRIELNIVIPDIAAFLKIALDTLKLRQWIVTASLLWAQDLQIYNLLLFFPSFFSYRHIEQLLDVAVKRQAFGVNVAERFLAAVRPK